MTALNPAPTVARPKWDGARIIFEILAGDEQVLCAISRSALEEISAAPCYKPADLMKCFTNARPRIEAAALRKLLAHPDGIIGRLNLWADDMELPDAAGDIAVPN